MGCRGCLVWFVILLLILAILGGGVYYLLTKPSPIVASLAAVTYSEDDCISFDRKLGRFVSDTQSIPESEDLPATVVEVTEAEATCKLVEVIEGSQLPFDFVESQVHFQNDRMQVSANVVVSNVVVGVAVLVQADVLDGKPGVAIEKIDLGSLTVPDALRRVIVDAVSAGIDPAKLDSLPFHVESIGAIDGVLTIDASRSEQQPSSP